MSTTSAISTNPTRNSGGTVLYGGNIDNENVANAPGIAILGLGAHKGSIANPYDTLINTLREDFERGVLGATTWGSGIGDSVPTLQNLSGSSGIYSPTPGSAGDSELLYITAPITKPFQADVLFYTVDAADAAPGSPGLVYRNNGSCYIFVQLRQTAAGIGRMHRISYIWNDVTTHAASAVQASHDFNILRTDTKDVVKLGMKIEGSGVTLYVNDVESISANVVRDLTDDPTFVGVRSVADSTPDCNYDIFEISENLTNDQPNLQRTTTAAPINDGQTILHDNQTIRDTLDNNIPAHRQKLTVNTVKKGGELDTPVTELPYYDETQTDTLGTGVTIDRANQSSMRFLEGQGAVEAPASSSYDTKN